MSYIYDIPRATDALSLSQGQIQGNFSAVGSIAGNSTTNSNSLNPTVGFNFVNLVPRNDTSVTGTNQLFLYNDLYPYAGTSIPEVYVQNVNNGVKTPITAGVPTGGNSGWTYLPSGMKIIWGQATMPIQNTAQPFTFPNTLGFPGFSAQVTPIGGSPINNVPNVQITPITASAGQLPVFLYLTAINAGGFSVRHSNGTYGFTIPFTWSAMGY